MKSGGKNNRLALIKEIWAEYTGKTQEYTLEKAHALVQHVGFLIKEAEKLTLNKYQAQAMDTAIYPKEHALDYCGLKLASEAGEVAGKLGKRYRDDGGQLTEKRIKDLKSELGGVLWYVAALSYELGFTLEEVAQYNLDQLADRKARGVLKGDGDHR